MADRSVVVRLRAEVASYIAGMEKARAATTQFGKEVAGKSSADVERLGTVGVVAGAAVAAGFAKAAFSAADFEKVMSGVKAVSGASSAEMERLSDAALAAGASTKLAGVTASDAAAAEAELVKAGVSVSDVLGGALMGSLTLAAAGQIDFANAATIAAQAMNIFDLSGRDVTHIADVLAAAANKSAADVGGLGDALRQGGLVAAQTGLSLDETVASLAAFADNALIGSDAGTSLKTMLQRLTPQSVEAANLMEELGFSAYDLQGNFIGLEGLAGELSDSFKGMTVEQRNSAMATLFGSDAVRGANVLYEQGAAGIREYIAAVDDEGAAARMAAIQNDNLKGDIEALGGALETALISNGSKATGALRGITQALTDVVGGFSAMPDTLQTVTVGLGGIVGAASLIGGGFISLAPKITASTDALKDMDSGLAKFAGNNLGKLTAGLAGVGAAVAVGTYAYGAATASARQYAEDVDALSLALDPVAEGQADLNEELANFLKLQQSGLSTEQISGLNELGISMEDVESAIKHGADALDPLRDALKELGVDLDGVDLGKLDDKGASTETLDRVAAAMGITRTQLKGLIEEMEDWDNTAQDAAKKTIEAAVNQETFSQSAAAAAIELNTLEDGTVNYAGALAILAPELVTTEEGVGDVEVAMDDAGEAADELKEAIERLMTPLDTRSALDQFAGGILDMADRFADADEAVADAQENMADRQRDLQDLLNTPADQRGDGYDRRVQDARDAIVDAQAAIDEAIADTSRTLEGNSQAALDNRDMLDALARDGAAAIEAAAADETLSLEAVMGVREYVIAQMEEEAERLGLNTEQVGFYTGALKEIPLGEIRTDIQLTGADEALAKIELLLTKLNRLSDTGQVYSVDYQQTEQQLARQQRNLNTGGVVYLAGGGDFRPRGTDTIPAMLTPGEYVVNAQATSRFGVSNLNRINSGQMSPMSGGSWSADNSRHVRFDAPINVVAPSPVSAASQIQFRLKRVALAVQG